MLIFYVPCSLIVYLGEMITNLTLNKDDWHIHVSMESTEISA